MKSNPEYERFSRTMDTVLRASPEEVKAAMEAEKRDRQLQQQITGKKGRGRPAKSSASSRASSEKD